MGAQGAMYGCRTLVVGWWLVSASVFVVGSCPVIHAEETATGATVHNNMDVGMEYTLTVDGAVVDSTEGKDAFHYIHGRQQVIPGLERQLEGLHVGDTKEVTVNPTEGYGAVDPAAFIEVPKTQLPPDVTPQAGMILRGVNPDGQSFRAKISEMKDETVVLDLNHPLAGKTLTFNVKITDISPAPPVPPEPPAPSAAPGQP